MELDVDPGSREAAQLLFVHDLEKVLPFYLIEADTKHRRQLPQEFEALIGRQLRTEFLRHLLGLCRLAFQVETADPARQIDHSRSGSPEQVRNCYSIDWHPVLDIIRRYVDRNWNLQFLDDRQTDRINSAPTIVHGYDRRARRKLARRQRVQRIS